MSDWQIKIENLGVTFPPQILRGINLTISKGDFIGIVGANGSGKTTLLRSVLGLVRYTEGNISIQDGLKLGYLPQMTTQKIKKFPAKVKEIIATGLPTSSSKGIFPAFHRQKNRVISIAKDLEIDDLLEKRVGDLSGGQLQRVLLARAVISKPDILFLDEPTSALDPQGREKFYELVKNLNTDGCTIVLISHDHTYICKYAKHILELDVEVKFFGEACGFEHNPHKIVEIGIC